MIWMYRKDLFEKHGDQMKQDLGFDPTPKDSSTWEEFYKTSKWFKDHADETKVPYGHGHQAKQHDSLMNDFSNVLWAYGGDYFKDGDTVGRLGSSDPGEPMLDSDEAIEAADVYRRLVSIAHPGSLGWDWDGLGSAFAAGQVAMAVNWHEFAAGNEDVEPQGQGRLRAPPPRPQAQREHVRRHGHRDQRHRPEEASRRPPGCSSTGRPPSRRSWPTSRATSAAARPTRDSVYKLPEVEKARKPPSKMPNILTADAVFEAWKPENIGLRPKIAAWNECDTTIFTQLSKMLAGQQGPEKCMANTKEGFEKAHRQRRRR